MIVMQRRKLSFSSGLGLSTSAAPALSDRDMEIVRAGRAEGRSWKAIADALRLPPEIVRARYAAAATATTRGSTP